MMALVLLIDLKTFTFDWYIYEISYIPTVFFPAGNFFCGIISFSKKKTL